MATLDNGLLPSAEVIECRAGTVALLSGGTAVAAPFHQFVPHRFSQPPTTAQCEAQSGIACYQPYQLQQVYDMKPLYRAGLTGMGKTIVLVDSYGSPTIRHDLATFDRETGLPKPPSLSIIQPAGRVPAYDSTNYDMGGWAFETTLDVEYAHAMAPRSEPPARRDPDRRDAWRARVPADDRGRELRHQPPARRRHQPRTSGRQSRRSRASSRSSPCAARTSTRSFIG